MEMTLPPTARSGLPTWVAFGPPLEMLKRDLPTAPRLGGVFSAAAGEEVGMGVYGAFLRTGNFTEDGTTKTVPLDEGDTAILHRHWLSLAVIECRPFGVYILILLLLQSFLAK
jgi:hypothetical protein